MMVSTEQLLAGLAPFLDLVAAPFTLPRSRLLVMAHGDGQGAPGERDRSIAATTLRVCQAEYERDLDDCVVIERLQVKGTNGEILPVTEVVAHRIGFGDGTVTLTFAGPGALSIGVRPGADAELCVELAGGEERRFVLGAAEPSVRVELGALREAAIVRADDHANQLRLSEGVWREWFDRCPRVRGDLQAMTSFCWWVLGANTIELPGQGKLRAVVPSKIGYVGLWQWDAYFIAVGLRHGDVELAREQLELAFRFPTADGQLPDVVHDHGTLASSDDLPPADRETLRRQGSSLADPDRPVPLTKPPLAAWALRKVLDKSEPTPDISRWPEAAWATISHSQDWWFSRSDLDGDGMPEYGHPYSSGLDDSPIFDGAMPLASPDLASYLILQEAELERYFADLGNTEEASRHRLRGAATLERLLAMWDSAGGRFRARGGGHWVDSYTVVSLLPLLTGKLPSSIAQTLVAALSDPAQFRTTWTVPTVAVSDNDFSPERMWRGPVWINMNALLVEGLRRSGFDTQATELAERTVELVIHGGGPHEYFNPESGMKARTATTSFGWSAALFIDLAVTLSE